MKEKDLKAPSDSKSGSQKGILVTLMSSLIIAALIALFYQEYHWKEAKLALLEVSSSSVKEIEGQATLDATDIGKIIKISSRNISASP